MPMRTKPFHRSSLKTEKTIKTRTSRICSTRIHLLQPENSKRSEHLQTPYIKLILHIFNMARKNKGGSSKKEKVLNPDTYEKNKEITSEDKIKIQNVRKGITQNGTSTLEIVFNTVIKTWNWFAKNATTITSIALIITIILTYQQFELFRQEYEKQYGEPVIELYPSGICTDIAEDDTINFNKKVQLTTKINICNTQGKPAFITSIEYTINNTENHLVAQISHINRLLKYSECILINETIPLHKSYSELLGTYDLYSSVNYISTDNPKTMKSSYHGEKIITLSTLSIVVCQ